MSMISRLLLFLIRLYQKTWFLRRPSCRFYPSCSQYMATSVERFGFFAGLFAGCLRILRCHPFHPGGVDKVPERFSDLLKSDLLKVNGLVKSQVRLDACCEAEHNHNFNFIPGMRGTRTRGER